MLNEIKKEFREAKTLLLFGSLRSLEMAAPLIVAKFFSEDAFGSFSLAKMVVFLFATLLVTSPQVPFVVHANRERSETGKINKSFSIQLVFLVFSILAFSIVCLAASDSLAQFAGISRGDLLFLVLGFTGISLRTFLANLLLALGRRIANATAELVAGLVTLGLTIALFVAGELTIKTVFLTYFVSGVILLPFFVPVLDFRLLAPFTFVFSQFRQMFAFTRWVFIGAAATYFIDWGDNVILKIFNVSMADIGSYALAYQIFNGLVGLIYVLNGYFLPFISENIKDVSRIHDYLYNKRPRIFLFGFALLVIAFFVCPYLFQLIYENAYPESIAILRILLVGCVLILYSTFYLPLLNALKLYRFSQTTNVAVMTIKVLLNIALIYLYGLTGAAVGTVLSYACATAIYEIYYRTRMKRLLGVGSV